MIGGSCNLKNPSAWLVQTKQGIGLRGKNDFQVPFSVVRVEMHMENTMFRMSLSRFPSLQHSTVLATLLRHQDQAWAVEIYWSSSYFALRFTARLTTPCL